MVELIQKVIFHFHIKEETTDDNRVIYQLEIDNPNLFYTYSLEWDFINVKS